MNLNIYIHTLFPKFFVIFLKSFICNYSMQENRPYIFSAYINHRILFISWEKKTNIIRPFLQRGKIFYHNYMNIYPSFNFHAEAKDFYSGRSIFIFKRLLFYQNNFYFAVCLFTTIESLNNICKIYVNSCDVAALLVVYRAFQLVVRSSFVFTSSNYDCPRSQLLTNHSCCDCPKQ